MAEIPETDELVELLDAYLSQLQRGEWPDREAILRRHPELALTLDCLEMLERLAPPSGPQQPGAGPVSAGQHMPQDFGDYELLAEIGRGGMGVVYKARQKQLDRVVAVKMILSSHLASEEHVRRFREEARAAASPSATPTSSTSTRWASTTASTSSPWSTSTGPAWQGCSARVRSIRTRPPGSWPKWPRPSTISTSTESSTAT